MSQIALAYKVHLTSNKMRLIINRSQFTFLQEIRCSLRDNHIQFQTEQKNKKKHNNKIVLKYMY